MDITRTSRIAALAGALGLALASLPADAETCKLYPASEIIDGSYELVGAEACEQWCGETEGCIAWSYTPHTFNPDTGPGHCRLLSDVGEEVEDAREICGYMEE
ncbi:MAG: hypothetical protein H6842_11020 [Rhodospirillaceae bacterium]|nr:hypothetical protein [Rhodospirillaceae bacterium]